MHRAIFTAAILTTTTCGLTSALALAPATQPAPAASAASVPAAPTAAPADDLHSAISQIEQSPDPSAAIQAYAQSAAAHHNNTDLERAYVHRMIQFGAPQLAYSQAQDLAQHNAADADAWTVCAYVAAQHRDLTTAGADLKTALAEEPNNPFALRTAGQIVQWYDAQSDRSQISPQASSAVEWLRANAAHATAFADAYRESAARQSPTTPGDQSSPPETIQNPYAEQTPPEDDQSAPVTTYIAPTYSEPAQTYVATPVYPYSTYTYTSPYYGGYYYGGYTPWYGGYGYGGYGRSTIIITGNRHDHHDNDHHDGDHHGDWNHHDAGNFHGGSGGDHGFHSSSPGGFVGPLPSSHSDHSSAGHFDGGHSSFHASPSNSSSGGSQSQGGASSGGGHGGSHGGGHH